MSQPVAIVTGAGRGIGAATVAALVADGWWVAAVDRCSPHPAIAYPMASSDNLADVVTAADGNAAAFEADVSVGAEVAEVVASVTGARGRLDAVVCAAGVVAGGSPAWEIDDTEWDAVIGTDLTGVFTTARAAVPALLAAPHGRIVTVASAAGSLLGAALSPASGGACPLRRARASAAFFRRCSGTSVTVGLRRIDRTAEWRVERRTQNCAHHAS